MEINDFKKYMKHLPNCNIMQNWSEAETAMADTPERFRDHDWAIAIEELNIKMGTCTCGLEKLLDDAKALPIPDVSGLLPSPKQAQDLADEDWDKTCWQYDTCDNKTIYSWGFQNAVKLCKERLGNNR